jgi:hypothetical protein
MKLIPSAQATPSVFKGIYTVLFLVIFTHSLSAQSNSWNVGFTLNQSNNKELSYGFIAKKYLSPKVALRLGINGSFNTYDKDFYYNHPYDSLYNFKYEYNKMYKNLYAQGFIGLQYGRKKNTFSVYGATDLIFNYSWEKSDVPKGILFPGTQILPVNDFFNVGETINGNTIGLGVRQVIGFELFVTNTFSIAIESGVRFMAIKKNADETLFFYKAPNNSGGGNTSGGVAILKSGKWNNALTVNPLTLISLNYHF